MGATLKIIQETKNLPLFESNALYSAVCQRGTLKNTVLFMNKQTEFVQAYIMSKAAVKFEYVDAQLRLYPLSEFGLAYCKSIDDVTKDNKSYVLDLNVDKVSNITHPGLAAIRKLLNVLKENNIEQQCPILFGFEFYNTIEDIERPSCEQNPQADIIGYIPEEGFIVSEECNKTKYFINGLYENKVEIKKQINDLKIDAIDNHVSVYKHNDIKDSEVDMTMSDEEFKTKVKKIKKYIQEGEAYQVVLSRRFKLPCQNPFVSYLNLYQNNPSPYHFYYAFEDSILFGASPETNIQVEKNKSNPDSERVVRLFPIAGTQPRGFNEQGKIDPEKDIKQETKLRLDKKELSEHMMLVDLARNDIAKIAIPGSCQVKSLTEVVKYSKVMHLVSVVEGLLENDFDELNSFAACLNMGTLSGAPKKRAIEILQKYESNSRGSYGGAVGLITNFGICDTAIVIRSALVKNHTAFVQAGAGIVYDSDPSLEAQETRHKARAVILAIQQGAQYA